MIVFPVVAQPPACWSEHLCGWTRVDLRVAGVLCLGAKAGWAAPAPSGQAEAEDSLSLPEQQG